MRASKCREIRRRPEQVRPDYLKPKKPRKLSALENEKWEMGSDVKPLNRTKYNQATAPDHTQAQSPAIPD
jgi:hypothetical protein